MDKEKPCENKFRKNESIRSSHWNKGVEQTSCLFE